MDFIFGGATVWFERCWIECRGDGYITAASRPEGQPFGYVFSHCEITGAQPGLQTYLGQPWRDFAGTIFLNTQMSAVVRPAGWHNWSKPERERITRYAEFGSIGPGANAAERVPWARQLTRDQAHAITVPKVLAGHESGIRPRLADRKRSQIRRQL